MRESIERMNREAAANLIQRQQAAAAQQIGMAAGMNPMMMGQMANMANNPYMQGGYQNPVASRLFGASYGMAANQAPGGSQRKYSRAAML